MLRNILVVLAVAPLVVCLLLAIAAIATIIVAGFSSSNWTEIAITSFAVWAAFGLVYLTMTSES